MHICAKGLRGSDKLSLAIWDTCHRLGQVRHPLRRRLTGQPTVGELIDAIVKEVEAATSDQSHSEGATDTDVPAKEGQVEERAWELFTG